MFEIPVYACLGNARPVAASTAIKLLSATGFIDVISFNYGESGNLERLTEIA